MSRFDNLDDQLRRDEATKQALRDELFKRADEAKKRYLPQIERAYAVVGDFHQTLLQPRGYLLRPRKKEEITEAELTNPYLNISPCIYVLNISPTFEQQPYPQDKISTQWWKNPIIPDYNNAGQWHPNVALHFQTGIVSRDPKLTSVKFEISMKAWGFVKHQSETILPQWLTISTHSSWHSYATQLWIAPDEETIEEQVETGLRILTPNIIQSQKAFRENHL